MTDAGAGRIGRALAGAAAITLVATGVALASPTRTVRPPKPPTAVQRGKAFAQRECSACHAVELRGDSPNAWAPPFRELHARFNPITFERRITEIGEGMHDKMPAVDLFPNDVHDLAAYIESLDGR